ncbi:MAG: hypothetical protein H5T85_00470 [Actinobacteria bacterium]|nr:hypothetical protein [Actinomycetota bacterium]
MGVSVVMSVRLAEKEKIYRRDAPILYLVKNDAEEEGKKILYVNKSIFPILLVVISFLCLGVLFNIGLRVQNISYERRMYEIGQMISLEEERRDRLLLEISELKSPSRVISKVENGSNIEGSPGITSDIRMSNDIKVVEIPGDLNLSQSTSSDGEIYSSTSEHSSSFERGYDNVLGVIYYVQDIIMVMSESVLTFFIP